MLYLTNANSIDELIEDDENEEVDNTYIYCESIGKKLYMSHGIIYKKMNVFSQSYCDQKSSTIEMRYLSEPIN
ncbi:MAG: hypothetical protein ACR2PT_04970 [Endozoicomonas sp.]